MPMLVQALYYVDFIHVKATPIFLYRQNLNTCFFLIKSGGRGKDRILAC